MNLEPQKFELSKCPFYTSLSVSIFLSFLAQLDANQDIKNLVSLSQSLLNESKAIKTYEFFLYVSFVFTGLAGFAFAKRHVALNKWFKGPFNYFISGLLVTGGVLLGWGYGVLSHAIYFDTTSNITHGIGIVSLFSLFILVPVFIVYFWIAKVNENREPITFKSSIKNKAAFQYLSLCLFSVGAFGVLNMIM